MRVTATVNDSTKQSRIIINSWIGLYSTINVDNDEEITGLHKPPHLPAREEHTNDNPVTLCSITEQFVDYFP